MRKYIVSVLGGVVVAVALVVACMTFADLTYAQVRAEAKDSAETARTLPTAFEVIEITKAEETKCCPCWQGKQK